MPYPRESFPPRLDPSTKSDDPNSVCGDCRWERFVPSRDRRPKGSGLCRNCRNHTHNTNQVNRRRPSSEYPLVSVSALLQLSDWLLAHRITNQGGNPCDNRKKRTKSAVEPFMGVASGRDTTTHADDAQPNCDSADSITSQRTGGES